MSQPDQQQHQRDYYAHELEHHRARVWSIFAWASGVLFTSLGGTLAVSAIASAKGQASPLSGSLPIGITGKGALLIAIGIITVFSAWWMAHHALAAQAAKAQLQMLAGIPLDRKDFAYWMSHLGSSILTLIGVAVVVGLLVIVAP